MVSMSGKGHLSTVFKRLRLRGVAFRRLRNPPRYVEQSFLVARRIQINVRRRQQFDLYFSPVLVRRKIEATDADDTAVFASDQPNIQYDLTSKQIGANKIMIHSNPRKKEAVFKKTPPPPIC